MSSKGTRCLAGCAAVIAASVALTGCGSQSDDQRDVPATEAQGVSLESETDSRTGAVILPYDRFVETPEETAAMTAAAAVAISVCAAAEGVEFVPPALLVDPVYASEQYFGPWTRDQAQRFAFVMPMTEADLAANGITGAVQPPTSPEETPNSDLTESDWAVVDACGSAPDVVTLNDALTEVGPWVEPMSMVHQALLGTSEAEGLIQQLGACLEEAGLQVDARQGWVPAGAQGREISEEQIRLALHVVECKDAIDFTHAMAAVEAGLQAPIIAEYVDELVAERQSTDEAMVLARALLAQAGQSAETRG